MAKKQMRRVLGATLLIALSGCTMGDLQFGSRTLSFGGDEGGGQTMEAIPARPNLPTGSAQSFGRGPVKVALLLPLSGDASLASIGTSMANASRQAIAFVEANPNIAENITITLRDTGSTAQGAATAASAAVADGAKLILGPLRADQVTAAGTVARSAGLPLIGFSNNPGAASPGVYLLSVLPDAEMKRSLNWIKAQGRRGIAGIFPATEFGQAQETAFRQQAIAAGFSPQAVYTFSNVSEASQIIAQALPEMQKGMIDTLYLPDRASAPTFGTLLAQAGMRPDDVQIVGSADWDGDPAIAAASQLTGAIYPSVDPAGRAAISADYAARFGGQPHALATIAYTATILANVNTLSMAPQPYNATLLTAATGFNGRDGVFRFLGNGKSEYGLVLKKLAPGGAQVIEGVKF